MTACAIVEAITEFRALGVHLGAKALWYEVGHSGPTRFAETLHELLAQSRQSDLRARVTDSGISAFLRSGLPEMYRIARQVDTIAPDKFCVGFLNKWWAGIGVEGTQWRPYRHVPCPSERVRCVPRAVARSEIAAG